MRKTKQMINNNHGNILNETRNSETRFWDSHVKMHH